MYKGRYKYKKPKSKENSIESFIKIIAKKILSTIYFAKKHPIRAILFIVYLLFLYKIYPSMSIHEFSFFLLLLYIPFSLKLNLDERIPVAIALFLLILSAITLAQGFEERANTIAIYAYYFLVIGVVLMFWGYVKESKQTK